MPVLSESPRRTLTIPTELDVPKALALLQELVDEAGEDFVYQAPPPEPGGGRPVGRCRYVYQDKPSCMIAQLLHKAGVPTSELKVLDGLGAVQQIVSLGVLPLSHRVAQVLNTAQAQQDSGETWGRALAAAKARAAFTAPLTDPKGL